MLNRRTTIKATNEPAVTAVELIAAIGRKRDALMQRDHSLLEEQIILERGKVAPVAPSAEVDPQALARELLNGFAPAAPAGRPGERLFDILRQRAAIDIALNTLRHERGVGSDRLNTRISRAGFFYTIANGT